MNDVSRREGPSSITRRRFLKGLSVGAVGAYAGLSGARSTAAYARTVLGKAGEPLDRRRLPNISCTVVDCLGCACGGDYYHCVGCSQDYFKCYTGHNCAQFFVPC